MKAWVLENIGEFHYKEVNRPEPDKGEVIVKVKAAGICGSDIQRVYENGAHKMPLIIGHEFSGQVESVGDSVSEEWIGRRVGIFPLIPCKKCTACISGQYEMCSNYNYLGSRTNGGFAEYVVVPEWNLITLPEEVSYEQAAMLEPMSVAVHAIRRLSITEESSVAVCGLGTIGQFFMIFLREKGIKNIYAIGSKESQKDAFLSMGFLENHFCNSKTMDVDEFINRNTGCKGVDVFFECVGKNETVSQAVNLTAAGGQICLVGNPYSDMLLDKKTYWKILRKQLSITGTWNSSFLGETDENADSDDWHYVLKCLKEGRIHPEEQITHRLSLPELDRGFHMMKEKTEPYVKIMYVVL